MNPHVVILGGGFGGLEAARRLKSTPVRITLVDRHNHHLFQPLLYQVATAALSPGDIASPIRWILRHQRNVRLITGGKEQKMSKSAEPMLPAQAVRLAECVQYADGSIVSRALVQKPVGSITLFAFDVGQGLNEHTAPYDAYAQILDGEGEFVIGGQVVNPKCGEAVLMPANVPHAVNARQRFKMLLTMIRG